MSETRREINFDTLIQDVNKWADDKGIGTAGTWEPQFKKVLEELGEYSEELAAGNNRVNEMMEFGDILVTLIIMAKQRGYQADTCLNMAYNKIKNRKGKTINGTFVKELDLEKAGNELRFDSDFADKNGEKIYLGDGVLNAEKRPGLIVYRYGRYQVKYDNCYTDLTDEHNSLTLKKEGAAE